MRSFILIILCLFSVSVLEAKKKSNPYKPKWVTHKLPESKSETYSFINSYGEGTTLEGNYCHIL